MTLKCSETCHNDHCEKIAHYTADQIVAINESAATEHTWYHHHEWSPFDITPCVYNPFHQTECWSILPAYTKNEVLCHLIWKGSINTARMLAFLKKAVLPHCNAYLRPWSVLLMNNCSIHHNEASSILSYHQNADVEMINDNENSSVLIRSSIYTTCAHNMMLNFSFYLPTHQTSILSKSSSQCSKHGSNTTITSLIQMPKTSMNFLSEMCRSAWSLAPQRHTSSTQAYALSKGGAAA